MFCTTLSPTRSHRIVTRNNNNTKLLWGRVVIVVLFLLHLATCCLGYDRVCPTGSLRTVAFNKVTGEVNFLTTQNGNNNHVDNNSSNYTKEEDQQDPTESHHNLTSGRRLLDHATGVEGEMEHVRRRQLGVKEVISQQGGEDSLGLAMKIPMMPSSFSLSLKQLPLSNHVAGRRRLEDVAEDGDVVHFQVRQCQCSGSSSLYGDELPNPSTITWQFNEGNGYWCHASATHCGVGNSILHNNNKVDDDDDGVQISCFKSTTQQEFASHSVPYILIWCGGLFVMCLCYGQPAYQFGLTVLCKQPERNEQFVDAILRDHETERRRTREVPSGDNNTDDNNDNSGGETTDEEQVSSSSDNDNNDTPQEENPDNNNHNRRMLLWVRSYINHVVRPQNWQWYSWRGYVETHLLARVDYLIRSEEAATERARQRRRQLKDRNDSRMELRVRKFHHHNNNDKMGSSKTVGIEEGDETERGSDDDDENDDTKSVDEPHCTICFGPLDEGDRVGDLDCVHAFHVECLTRWVARRNACPLCNVPIAKRHCEDSNSDDHSSNDRTEGSESSQPRQGTNPIPPPQATFVPARRQTMVPMIGFGYSYTPPSRERYQPPVRQQSIEVTA